MGCYSKLGRLSLVGVFTENDNSGKVTGCQWGVGIFYKRLSGRRKNSNAEELKAQSGAEAAGVASRANRGKTQRPGGASPALQKYFEIVVLIDSNRWWFGSTQCIAIRYSRVMGGEVKTEQYRALAELRHQIRQFLSEGDHSAREAGLEPQQYLLLLMIRGLAEGQSATIRTLAERLSLKHHSAVELVDRLEANGYVRRARARDDRRNVIVSLLSRGERMLALVARQRIKELRSNGHELVRAIDRLLDREGKAGANGKRAVGRGGKKRR